MGVKNSGTRVGQGLAGCNSDGKTKKDETPKKEDQTKKLYSTGDTVTYTYENGNKAFSFTINSVKNLSKEDAAFDQFEEDEQPIEVTYTYNVIDLPNVEDANFLILPTKLKVANENKNVTNHSFPRMSNYPNGVSEGYSETVKAYYGLKGNNKKSYISYDSRDFKGSFEFECYIE